MSKTRWDFVPQAVKNEMGVQLRTHRNFIDATEKVYGKGRGVARPGKTAHEAFRRASRVKVAPSDPTPPQKKGR